MTKDIADTFEELFQIFNQISQDNITRSNLKIQKWVIILAFTSAIIAFYATNSDWTSWEKGWIQYFWNTYIHIQIPNAPNVLKK